MGQVPNNSTGEQATNTPDRDHGPDGCSLDVILETLVSERRRNVLYVLYRRTGPIPLAALADEVASLEGADPDSVSASLHHVHLPKLADAGVADYDAEEGTVRFVDLSERFREYLALVAEDERRPLRRAAESATLSEF